MSFVIANIKKFPTALAVAILSFGLMSSLQAQTTTTTAPASSSTGSSSTGSSGSDTGGMGAYLAQIASNTAGALTALTSIQNPVVSLMMTALNNLTSPDTSTNPQTPTPVMQQNFTNYVAASAASQTGQITIEKQLASHQFGSFTTTTVPYANDLLFTNLLANPPPVTHWDDPRPNASSIDYGLNYLQYASGAMITHAPPDPTWKGYVQDQVIYGNYFGTVNAVQTFNAYVLSQLYEDNKNGVPAAQTLLVNQATDPANWYSIITTESIGAVLRQSLMYQSQTYILMMQLLQTEKMLLAAQAMNNTLLVLSSQTTESYMVKKAINKLPGT